MDSGVGSGLASTMLRSTLLVASATCTAGLSIATKLGGTQLTPLTNGRVAGPAVPLSSLYEERGAVVFAVRRPGWILCREEAADLCSALSGESVPVVAVVKEEELPPPVEAEKMRGLTDFQEQYFCGPLYLSDEPRTLYEFLGNKPIFTWRTLGKALRNPLKTRRELKEMGERLKNKGLEGNLVGDGLTLGGVLCIAPDGELLYTFYEDAGKGVPPECQAKIVEAVRAFPSRVPAQ